jgi:hypothetical protein
MPSSPKEFFAAGLEAFAVPDDVSGGDDGLEEGASCREGQAREVVAFEPGQVENIVDEGTVGFAAPVLQCAKIGLAFFIEDDDLAVDDGVDGPFFQGVVD